MGRKKLLGIAALLSALLIVPLAVGANLINVADLPFFGGAESSSSTTVFAGPSKILNESLQSSSNFTVNIVVGLPNVTDLFTWQISINWNSSILNVSRIIPGEFLARSAENTSSEALSIELGYDVVINSTDNGQGFSLFAESILANVSGISGNGTLVSVKFLVLEYGWTDLNITVTGDFPTTLLDSDGNNIAFTTVGYYSSFYFSNKIPGDVDGNGKVEWTDFGDLALAYGARGPPQVPEPEPRYNRQCDFDQNGKVEWTDFGDLALNYGKQI